MMMPMTLNETCNESIEKDDSLEEELFLDSGSEYCPSEKGILYVDISRKNFLKITTIASLKSQ